MTITKRKSIIILCAIMLAVAIAVPAFANNIRTNRIEEDAPIYPVNEIGLTYGSGAKASSFETEPDLIEAMGKDGIIGYVYATDLRGPIPNSPAEALAIMEKRSDQGRSIPLYKVDGKTVIGEFMVGGGVFEEVDEKGFKHMR